MDAEAYEIHLVAAFETTVGRAVGAVLIPYGKPAPRGVGFDAVGGLSHAKPDEP